jgi:hypothetical protein
VAGQATLRRLFAAAALVALLALALLLLRIVVSIALFIVATVAGLLALAAGAPWLTRRAADRDAATR